MLLSHVQCDRSPGWEWVLLAQHIVRCIWSPFVISASSEAYKMTSWINTCIRFILSLLSEVMSVLLIWQAIQSFQKRLAPLKESHFSKELGRLILHSLRVCTRACAENQTTSRGGTHPEITSKGCPYQRSAEIGNASNLEMFLQQGR